MIILEDLFGCRRRTRSGAAWPPPCEYCGAPRITGTTIRTCSTSCLIGVDPRLADYLGLPRWTVDGTFGTEEDA